MAGSNVFPGKSGRLGLGASSSVAHSYVGALTGYSVNVTRGTAPATNFNSSGWQETIPTIASWTMTADALTLSTASTATSQQDVLRETLSSETRKYFWFLNSTSAGGYVESGYGYVTSWGQTGGLEDVQVSNFEITGDGPLRESASS